MKKMELVFIPWPDIGHLSSTIHVAHLLLRRDHRLSVTMLLITPPWEPTTTPQLQSLISSSTTANPIRFITLPPQPISSHDGEVVSLYKGLLDSQKQHVKEAVAERFHSADDSPTLAGFVIDMTCAVMMDVADEFRVPFYVFFTSSVGNLSFMLQLQELYYRRHNKESQQFIHSDMEITVPGFTNQVPSKAIPSVYFEKSASWIHEGVRRYRESSGVLINTFSELESQVLDWFSDSTANSKFPPLYTVGPILNLNNNISAASEESENGAEILKWLDEQPPSSVVFLCFGSWGSFNPDQAREVAHGLERSGYRFVWSLRQQKSKFEKPIDYANVEDVLPEGFLGRTAEIGRVIGWAPQVEILCHSATGGFISHCGWNSILESLWYGVPIGTWPMYAEQHFNAVELGVELGLTVEISSDFRPELEGVTVSAEEIESGIRSLMGSDNEVRKLVKAKSEESRRSLMEGGSSCNALNRFIEDVIAKSNCLCPDDL